MMKDNSDWSEEQKLVAERIRKAWEAYFSRVQPEHEDSAAAHLGNESIARISRVRDDHEAELLRYPNVVGVSEGIRMTRGKLTGEPCLVVYVKQKLPPNKLKDDEILPNELDGIPVDVVEVGEVELL